MLNFKNFAYALLCLSFSIIIGAGVYEHVVVWPKAYAAIPASLSMFQGEYGLNAAPFWMNIHPVTLLLFIVSTVLAWKTGRRNNVVIPFIGYILVMVATFTYFVPELMELGATEYVDTVDEALTKRGTRWENLSLIRIFFLAGLTLFLYLGLTKSELKKN